MSQKSGLKNDASSKDLTKVSTMKGLLTEVWAKLKEPVKAGKAKGDRKSTPSELQSPS